MYRYTGWPTDRRAVIKTAMQPNDARALDNRALTRLVTDGLEVGWLAVCAAPEWLLWTPRESPETGQMA